MGLDISVYKILKKKGNSNYSIKLYDDNLEYKNDFPQWTKAFESFQTLKFYDWDKFKEITGIDISKYDCLEQCISKEESYMLLFPTDVEKPRYEDYNDYEEYNKELSKHSIKINFDDIPTFKKRVKVLWRKEVGYQRKGLNGKFYDDYEDGKIGYYVWTKEELERYKKEYAIEPDIFQRNIIDEFTEGEDVVTFDW